LQQGSWNVVGFVVVVVVVAVGAAAAAAAVVFVTLTNIIFGFAFVGFFMGCRGLQGCWS
jgi:hypothetical protein